MNEQLSDSEQSASRAFLDVHYRLEIPVDHAEAIVGRPWTHDGEDDDSFECELEEKVRDGLPDMIFQYALAEPDVEFWG